MRPVGGAAGEILMEERPGGSDHGKCTCRRLPLPEVQPAAVTISACGRTSYAGPEEGAGRDHHAGGDVHQKHRLPLKSVPAGRQEDLPRQPRQQAVKGLQAVALRF